MSTCHKRCERSSSQYRSDFLSKMSLSAAVGFLHQIYWNRPVATQIFQKLDRWPIQDTVQKYLHQKSYHNFCHITWNFLWCSLTLVICKTLCQYIIWMLCILGINYLRKILYIGLQEILMFFHWTINNAVILISAVTSQHDVCYLQ